MPKSRSFDASIADLRSIREKLMPDSIEGEGEDKSTREEMIAEMRAALREGLVSSDAIADEIIYDIMLTASNPQDRMRAAELVKKSADSKKGAYVGKPPGEDDLERFTRIIAEVGVIGKSIDERKMIAEDTKGLKIDE